MMRAPLPLAAEGNIHPRFNILAHTGTIPRALMAERTPIPVPDRQVMTENVAPPALRAKRIKPTPSTALNCPALFPPGNYTDAKWPVSAETDGRPPNIVGGIGGAGSSLVSSMIHSAPPATTSTADAPLRGHRQMILRQQLRGHLWKVNMNTCLERSFM